MEDRNTRDYINEESMLGYIQMDTFPVLPLRGMVAFPDMTIHLDVGRQKSIEGVNIGMKNNRKIFLVTQKDPLCEDPGTDDLYDVGIVADIKQIMKLPNGIVRILIDGIAKGYLKEMTQEDTYYQGVVEMFPKDRFIEDEDLHLKALMRLLIHEFTSYVEINGNIASELLLRVQSIKDPDELGNVIASSLSIDFIGKQHLLEMTSVQEKLEEILEVLAMEKNLIQLESEINEKVKENIDKAQKEYYLREQLRVIKKELNEKVDFEEEIDKLRERLKKGQFPKEVKERIKKEIDRLEFMPSNMTEGSVIRTYIEWLLDLPWLEKSEELIDLDRVTKVLDEGHYGLEEPKKRILEYLAVRKLTKNKGKAPILCFVGPPGIGKTSLASSIGDAISRKFSRMSLGGVRDEAEIRGHRRTYVGALPGRIMQSLKQVGTNNPVLLLDEIDKLGADYKGDPSSALLEVLDPEQNKMFSDHYIELPFDLSDVMFITTANSLRTIPGPLRDRMEIIELSSYTEKEKLEIAKKHLFPKQIKENGLGDYSIKMNNGAFLTIVREYTREAGVRNLEREIGSLLRKVAVEILGGKIDTEKPISLKKEDVYELLGTPKVNDYGTKRRSEVGVVNGLAVTSLGGEVLTVEGTTYKGKGALLLTGQLGDVMKESVQAALSYLKSKGILKESLDEQQLDLHIHVPEGAIPKDGPSAGVAMATVMASIFLNRKVRHDLAMTGEVTIRGHVLPIGGVKEKVLAAYKEGIRTVLLPKGNERNVEDIPEEVREKMNIILVEELHQVLDEALVK